MLDIFSGNYTIYIVALICLGLLYFARGSNSEGRSLEIISLLNNGFFAIICALSGIGGLYLCQLAGRIGALGPAGAY